MIPAAAPDKQAAVLVSRLHLLPWEKIQSEIDYLGIAIEKTAGAKERQAWDWLMEAVTQHREKQNTEERT